MSGIRSENSFDWQPQPETWQWLNQVVHDACRANPLLHSLRSEMLHQTGTRLVDWLDHVALTPTDVADSTLGRLGFEFDEERSAWTHSAGLFPPVVRPGASQSFPVHGLGVKVESVGAFLSVQDPTNEIVPEGDPDGPFRYAVVSRRPTFGLSVVQRLGWISWQCPPITESDREAVNEARQSFSARPRPLVDPQAGFEAAERLFEQTASQLGTNWACALFFAIERDYWQSRNKAAQRQRQRQDRLGLGWANHDHHTYRCSREYFATLIALLEKQGFVCRERFYAGSEAGWGAQVLEQPACNLVVFADVDLSPEEVLGDFAHEGLAPRRQYGTVGLWCQLHGEAIMAAGMHHLECQFAFDRVRKQLADAGIGTMDPFTDFSYLRQAFTEAEMWPVETTHLRHLVAQGVLSEREAHQFLEHGARGSHLELLQRNDGYKGFNQTGISDIIARTDPRSS